MAKVTPTLWYDGTAEEAGRFYVTVLPDRRIAAVNRPPVDMANIRCRWVFLFRA